MQIVRTLCECEREFVPYFSLAGQIFGESAALVKQI